MSSKSCEPVDATGTPDASTFPEALPFSKVENEAFLEIVVESQSNSAKKARRKSKKIGRIPKGHGHRRTPNQENYNPSTSSKVSVALSAGTKKRKTASPVDSAPPAKRSKRQQIASSDRVLRSSDSQTNSRNEEPPSEIQPLSTPPSATALVMDTLDMLAATAIAIGVLVGGSHPKSYNDTR